MQSAWRMLQGIPGSRWTASRCCSIPDHRMGPLRFTEGTPFIPVVSTEPTDAETGARKVIWLTALLWVRMAAAAFTRTGRTSAGSMRRAVRRCVCITKVRAMILQKVESWGLSSLDRANPMGVRFSQDIHTAMRDKPMTAKPKTEAVAYIRTSSAANVGADKDSDKRQRAAITAFAKGSGLVLVAEFTDAAVSGAPIQSSHGRASLPFWTVSRAMASAPSLSRMLRGSARDLMTQELGVLALINRGVRVPTASGDDLTDSSDPSRVMMRQIAGAFHQYEKARLVAELRGARDASVLRMAANAKAARAGPRRLPRWQRKQSGCAVALRPDNGHCVRSQPSWPSVAIRTSAARSSPAAVASMLA